MNENELILCDLLKCNRTDLYLKDLNTASLNADQLALFLDIIKKRGEGFPLQYLLEKCEFFGLQFNVRPGVFIPRPETEILVEEAIKISSQLAVDSLQILEIGTGSGNIAISLAKNIPNSKITAIDISLEAIELAKENARLNGVAEKIEFIQSDIFSEPISYDLSAMTYDLIISNPPYIRTGDLESLPIEVRQEPIKALDGGVDGLEFYREILKISKKLLAKGGYLIFEVGLNQAQDFRRLKIKDYRLKINSIIKDYNNIERVVILKFNP